MLTPSAVLARLDRRLAILTGGGADQPERHQTLRATLDWSFELLDSDARTLLASLSVFAGGFDLDAVETVCGQGMDSPQTLIEHSLVRLDESAGEPRFSMPRGDPRDSAKRWAERGDEMLMRVGTPPRSCDAETHRSLILGPDGSRQLDRLERDHDNLKGALRWAIDRGDAKTALRLVASLRRFWQLRGHLDEGRQWAEAALALSVTRPDLAAERSAAWSPKEAPWQADMTGSTARYVEALALARAADDGARIAEALGNLGMMIASTGHTVDAATMSPRAWC